MDSSKQTVTTAAAIVIGFTLVAAAIFFSGSPLFGASVKNTQNSNEGGTLAMSGTPKREVEELRRIYGNPDADTTIVEFSDFECPFCARLHPTLKQVVDESEGAINWEFRHLPLTSHPGALPAAIASECVGDLAGNDSFWSFVNTLFANQRALTASFLESEAIKLGVDSEAYRSCLVSEEIAQRVDTDLQTAVAQGGSGTPFSVIEFADGATKSISGALPYQNWVQALGIN